jgi:hypothetical protein
MEYGTSSIFLSQGYRGWSTENQIPTSPIHSPDLVLKMTDPLDALPYEVWVWCITFAIDGRKDGPLELLAVSSRWAGVLLDTPSLWNQIYIENGEDEIARICTFLYLSRGCSLHVDIMTGLPSLDSLQLIVDHVSRVSTISIRPSAADTVTAFDMQQWEDAAIHILGRLSNGPFAVKDSCCFGISLRENQELYYCVFLMQFTMGNIVKSTDTQDSTTSARLPATTYPERWDECITRCVCSLVEEISLNIAEGTLAFPQIPTPTPEPIRLIHWPSLLSIVRHDNSSYPCEIALKYSLSATSWCNCNCHFILYQVARG